MDMESSTMIGATETLATASSSLRAGQLQETYDAGREASAFTSETSAAGITWAGPVASNPSGSLAGAVGSPPALTNEVDDDDDTAETDTEDQIVDMFAGSVGELVW